MGDDVPKDARCDWLEARVVPLLKSKSEFFQKLLATEEADIIRKFVNDEHPQRLFFNAGPKDILVSDKPPDDKQTKKKCVFVLKTGEHKFTEEKVHEMLDKVIVGDLSPTLLQNLHGLLRNVYLPLISNPKNTVGWPEVAMKAFTDKYHYTLAAVVVAIGQTQGKTLLALPPGEMLSNSGGGAGGKQDRADKDRVHILESAVVMWTERINTVRH